MKNLQEQQTRRTGRAPGLLIVLPVLLAAFLMYGCGVDPVSPTSDQGSPLSLGQAPGHLAVDRTQDCAEVSGWVTVEAGGSIDLGLKGKGGMFDVAPGSIDQDRLVKISVCRNEHPFGGSFEFVEFEFLPDGVTFNPAATLTIKAGSLNSVKKSAGELKVITLYYFNEATGNWEVAAEAPVIKGKVVFKLDHFSKYGISS